MRQKYYDSIPGSKIGKDSRESSHFLKTPSHDKPAPGSYRTFSFVDKGSSPKFGFGTSQREKNYMISTGLLPPGPGKYES